METKARELANADPNSGFALKALSVSLQLQGKEALQFLERAALLLPNDAEVHSNLGTALRRAGRVLEAVASFGRAIAITPDIAEVHNNLGNALKDLGRLDEAVVAFRRALELKPDLAKSHNNLGNAFLDLGRLEDAVASYRQALALQPDYAEAHNNLGIALRLQSRVADAEISCRRALNISPDFPSAISLLAELHSDKGQFPAAEELFKRAILLEPESAEAWAGVAGLRRMTSNDAVWLAEAQRIVGHGLAPRQEACLRYAIGKYFDDVGNFEQAFANYRRANELTKILRPEHGRQQLTQAIDLIIRSFDEEWLSRARVATNASKCPVFIVGMPRSGTTLAEQILASHHEVFGAGELPFWSTSMSNAAARTDGEIGQSALLGLGDDYLRLLGDASNGAPRVVDKMPANFLYLGLIHAALPNAKIIHMRRNPIDTCLSIYFQNFGAVHSYANDLGDLAHYYAEYLRLMDHWRLNLPTDAILDLPYEELVEDQEAWSRRIVDFIGLAWDPSCLDFHQTSRTVSTFSKWQARQKISQSSVERWRNYREFAGPLLSLTELKPPQRVLIESALAR
jgi:tetratricopeptide (TPR) repeat protein